MNELTVFDVGVLSYVAGAVTMFLFWGIKDYVDRSVERAKNEAKREAKQEMRKER